MYDHNAYNQVSLLQAMEEASGNVEAETCQGWDGFNFHTILLLLLLLLLIFFYDAWLLRIYVEM